ncbi:MAG: electron transfer flavoprotein subunit beta/FixA family protein [Muribaculaceae bacterium]|nr:electron transfer flavoprotein subunit beta/FixA family protein [Muribaculaceae bacterium]
MSLNIVVLAKQVPDTRNVGKDAMKEDGTINRAALPAIFNPEDLNALEQALRLKDINPGSTVTVLTMGLPRAAEVIREAMYRGADGGIVLTDRALGGADTLATSYSLAQAVKKIGNYDIILGGRQAIDGDTAQVGPQIAEKLGIPQVTYAEEIIDLSNGHVTVKRRLENGVETVLEARPALAIKEWGADFVEADPQQIGLAGSPTKVKTVENVVFTAKENLQIDGSDETAIDELMKELIANHTIG